MKKSELKKIIKEVISEGIKDPFTDKQLGDLRDAYELISSIDPTSESYAGVKRLLNNMSDEQILQLIKAKPPIKILSKLALNVKTRRGLK